MRTLVTEGRFDEAWRRVVPELLSGAATSPWSVARNVIRAGASAGWTPPTAREIRLGVLCSYEAAELREQLRTACLALRIDAQLYAAPYGQLEQELLGVDTPLAAFKPTHVLIATTTSDLGFPELTDAGVELLAAAESRWLTLWQIIRSELGARVVQHAFVVPDETPLGHLSMRLPSSRASLVRELNRRLATAAGADVLLLDTDRLAARIGKQRWVDPRLWYAARQPFSHEALPVLARETAAVLAGDVGLAARCLVVDLDNTLWGGVVGDDGPDGIVVGDGPEGEAYADFHDYLRALMRRGVILAVASKNDLEAAREPFETNPAMRLRLDDFAAFVADWRPKSEQLTEIATTLGLGLDAIVFVDDNPAECAEVAAALPEVTTICLDGPPSERVRMIASCVRFELSSLSRDDLDRQRSYAARTEAAALRARTASLEDFWRSLEMRARVRRVDRTSIDRAAALTQKTNQFNLTLRRHSLQDIERLCADESGVCLTLELEDRFARHGLIGLGFIVPSEDDPNTALIDTLLLSCRVIGRTAEVHLLSHLARQARVTGFGRLRGIYVPGPRNGLVADLYPKSGFIAADARDRVWEHDLEDGLPIESLYIAEEP
jgi:FkbH-like protein